MERLRRIFSRSRAGEPYDGAVVRCNETARVKWPGWYGLDKKGELDPKCQVVYVNTGNYYLRGWQRVR